MTSQIRYHLSRWASLAGLVAAVGLLVIPARAAVILSSTDPHASDFSHSFSKIMEWMPGMTYDGCSLSFANSTAHLAQDSSVSITLNAPAGSMFTVADPPADSGGMLLRYRVVYGTGGLVNPTASIENVVLTFSGLVGDAPSLNLDSQILIPTENGALMSAIALTPVSSAFSFTGITLSFDYSGAVNDVQLGNFASGRLEYEGFTDADPGPLLSLTPIPEPGTTGVLAVGLLALIVGGHTWHQRRKAAVQH